MAILVSGEQVLVTCPPNSHMLAMALKYSEAWSDGTSSCNKTATTAPSDTIHWEFLKTVQSRVSFFHSELLRRLTTEPNNIFHSTGVIDPFLSKMPEDPNALEGPLMYDLFQSSVLTREGKKIGGCNFDHGPNDFRMRKKYKI
jgi:hypothetical protein